MLADTNKQNVPNTGGVTVRMGISVSTRRTVFACSGVNGYRA